MKLIGLVALAGVASAHSIAVEWTTFKRTHSKLYSPLEEPRRFQIFKENAEFVAKHNADYRSGKETYHVALNEFADLTNAEFHTRRLAPAREVGFRMNYQCPVKFADSGASKPDLVDWTTTNNFASTVAVTGVKDQGQCGSCWSFGSTGTYEGAYCIKNSGTDCSTWHGASEQQMCDCGGSNNADIGNYYDMGCNGGWIDNGLYYITQTGYIDTEDSYPYTSGTSGKTGSCQANPANGLETVPTCGATIKNSETDLMGAIAEVGPMGIAIDASGIGFQLYSGGVYTNNSCSSSRLNHAVLAVGYGTDAASGNAYFKVKNSWGKAWGDSGYILMRRNYNNMCGVAATPAYAIL